MKILLVGDIVGSPGRRVFKSVVKRLKRDGEINVVVANAENAAAGNGITQSLANELLSSGADVLTMGDHVWGQRELETSIHLIDNLVRPLNFPAGTPGVGSLTFQSSFGPLVVVNLQGRVFMNPIDCPFKAMDNLLKSLPKNVPIIVDFHAEATSEKIAMGYFLEGRVAAVVGTHTHVQTSDAKILPEGTAYMTDLGMTGPAHSVLGRNVTPVLKKFTTGMPARFDIAKGPALLEGAIIDIDRESSKVVSIKACRFHEDDLIAAD
ncbi:MAG: TIGR00282 family metallophosphoesterase [Kiritimatiellae bacterium]|jgi:metallophosphoesterase (TIGR00282 family)|nr:TIGR00282 family metallophosphoesterase [Kiritimatiellia bacterium]